MKFTELKKVGIYKPLRLRILFSVSVLLIILASGVVSSTAVTLLREAGALDIFESQREITIVISIVFSLAAGGVLTAVWVHIVMDPLCKFIEAINRVADGNYNTKIKSNGIFKKLMSREFRTVEDSFNHMTRELSSNELFRKDFISNFSHEFKTPIISICGFAEQIYQGNLTPQQQKEFARIIMEESSRLAELSGNVLLLSRFENQNIVTGKTKFSLAEQIRNCILLFTEQWGEKQLNLEIDLEEFWYYQNQEMLQLIWKNLISNAIKYTPAQGTIWIQCRKQEEGIMVSVRDNGMGMDEKTKQHIFDKFYQHDTSHATKGNGLGLAIVKQLVKILKGSIQVNSEPGKGSAFIVRLPLEEEWESTNAQTEVL